MISLVDALIFYAAYLSLSVARGLAVPIYKSRAIWMALVSVPLALAVTYTTVVDAVSPGSTLSATLISEVLFSIPLISLFVWIDRAIYVVIRLDYLRRDVLYWKRTRIVYWVLVFAGNVIFFSKYLYTSPILFVLPNITLAVTLLYGAASLVRGAATTRDATFRSHLKWFGYFAAVFVPAILIYTASGGPNVPSFLFLAAASYCFYRMARFLVPTGRLTTDLAYPQPKELENPVGAPSSPK